MPPLLTRQEANRKRLIAAVIGIVLAVVGFPFILRWEGAAPAPDTLDILVGGGLVFAGGLFLGAAGLNKVGVHWWQDVTEDDGRDDPLKPI